MTSTPATLTQPPSVARASVARIGARAERSHRYRLALVIGSGGVRGVAAVGIVERLARAGIAPDLIVGCSSGALFGAALAMDAPPGEVLHAATRLWSPELTQHKRWRALLQMVAPRLAGFGPDFALRSNRAIAATLRRHFEDTRIETLPIALRIAATEAATGLPVVLSEGLVRDAVLASMAVPMLFPSVNIAGRRLVDGVVSDPLPVAAAHDASVVIALGLEGAMPRRVDRPSRLVAQASTALVNNLMQARTDAALGRGQRIVPMVLPLKRRVGLWETTAMMELYEAGAAACETQLSVIRELLSIDAVPAMN